MGDWWGWAMSNCNCTFSFLLLFLSCLGRLFFFLVFSFLSFLLMNGKGAGMRQDDIQLFYTATSFGCGLFCYTLLLRLKCQN